MAYLHLPPRFRRPKPRWPARIDLSHPLAEGLVFAPLPDGHACIDLVTGEFALPRTGGVRVDWRVWDHPQYASTNDGHHDAVDEVYWQEASATDGGWYWPSIKQEDPRSLSGVDKASWAFWHLQASAPADDFGRLMDKSTGGSGADGWTIYYDKADLRLVFRHSGNADQAATGFHTGGDLDKWWPWVFTRNGTVCRWYQDRRMNDVTNDGTCAAGNFSTASADLAFGVSSPSWTAAYRPNNGGLALGFLWSNRVLEQDEARQWAADPWGLVEETADISYFLPLVVPRRSHMSLWGDFRRLGGPYPAAAPPGPIEETLALGISSGLTDTSGLVALGALVLGISKTQTATYDAILENGITLALTCGATWVGDAVVGEQISLDLQGTITTEGGLVLGDAITLSVTLDLSALDTIADAILEEIGLSFTLDILMAGADLWGACEPGAPSPAWSGKEAPTSTTWENCDE